MLADELRWFLVLADTENVSRAARAIGVSQPTLSRAIQRLERRLGAPLFDRRRQRLRLNAAGDVLRDHATRASRELVAAEDALAALIEPTPQVLRLAFLHSLGTWLVPELLGAFTQRDPTARFELTQDSADAVVAALRDGRADVALTSPRPPDPMLDWLPIEDEELALAVPLDSPYARCAQVRLADLAGERFIAMQSEFGLRQRVDALFRARGLTPDVVLESAEIATIRAIVATGFGIAVVPGPAHALPSSDLLLVPLADDDAYRSIGLCTPTGRAPSIAARRFRRIARERADRRASVG